MGDQIIDVHIDELCVESKVLAELAICNASPILIGQIFCVVVPYSVSPLYRYSSKDESILICLVLVLSLATIFLALAIVKIQVF